jgi:hypothetical protein
VLKHPGCSIISDNRTRGGGRSSESILEPFCSCFEPQRVRSEGLPRYRHGPLPSANPDTAFSLSAKSGYHFRHCLLFNGNHRHRPATSEVSGAPVIFRGQDPLSEYTLICGGVADDLICKMVDSFDKSNI